MNINNAKIVRDTERFLKRTEEYKENRELGSDENYEIHYILKKGDKGAISDVLAHAAYEDTGISFHPYGDTPLTYCFDWSFNYDDDLFEKLERGYEVVSMSIDAHFCIWATIEELQEEIDHPVGMQMYLAYCKRNGITNEKLQKSLSYSGMDAMTLYDGKTKPSVADIKPRDDYNR